MKYFLILILLLRISYCVGQNHIFVSFPIEHVEYKILEYSDFKFKQKIDTTYLHYCYSATDSLLDFLSGYILTDDDVNKHIAESQLTLIKYREFINDTLYYSVFSCFYPDSSYMLINVKQVLEHEQIHFDIYELYARRLKKVINSINWKNNDTIKVDSLFSYFEKKMDEENDQFDKEADAQPGNGEQQLEINSKWASKINKELHALEMYKSPYGEIDLKKKKKVVKKVYQLPKHQ